MSWATAQESATVPVIIIRANDPEQTRHEVGPETLVLPGDTIEVERHLF